MVLIRHLLTVRMHIEICLVDCTGVKHDPNSSPVFSNNFRAAKKIKLHASSTKSQQLRALKFLFYTALQITFLFSLLTRCVIQSPRLHCSIADAFGYITLFSLSGAKVRVNESSRERKFHPWNFRCRERKYVGTKVPVTEINGAS